MHVEGDTLRHVVAAVGCKVEGFPQSYPGLPVSCHILSLADFAMIITKVDHYLAGWKVCLLSPTGRLVLINVVVEEIPAYVMAALKLPPAVVKALDSLRRAFLWNAAERTSEVQCLVTWVRVCRAKDEGRLGVRDLATQNDYLLLKILHRLHSSSLSRWASWVWSVLGDDISCTPRKQLTGGDHWAHLRGLMPLYKGLSRVLVGNYRKTSFWQDHWLSCVPMRCAFLALASHASVPDPSVWLVRDRGLDVVLVPRLTLWPTGNARLCCRSLASTLLPARRMHVSLCFVAHLKAAWPRARPTPSSGLVASRFQTWGSCGIPPPLACQVLCLVAHLGPNPHP